MADRPPHIHLDDDERKFIEELFAPEHETSKNTPPDMWLAVPDDAQHLQQLLERVDAVYIEMQLRHYTLHFRAMVDVDTESGTHQLRLELTEIIEPQATARGYRLDIGETEIEVTDLSGYLDNLALANISTSGASLIVAGSANKLVPGKTKLRLRIRFPGSRSVTVAGTVVRRKVYNDKSQLALKFSRMNTQTQEQLNAFISEHALGLPRKA